MKTRGFSRNSGFSRDPGSLNPKIQHSLTLRNERSCYSPSMAKKTGKNAGTGFIATRIKGRFAPGGSGNPGGRGANAFGLTKAIQKQVDPDELIQILLAITRGQGVRVIDGTPIAPGRPAPAAVPVQVPAVKDRIKAASLLMEWGFTKPPSQKQIQVDDGRLPPGTFDERQLSDDDLAEIAAVLERARLEPPDEDDED